MILSNKEFLELFLKNFCQSCRIEYDPVIRICRFHHDGEYYEYSIEMIGILRQELLDIKANRGLNDLQGGVLDALVKIYLIKEQTEKRGWRA